MRTFTRLYGCLIRNADKLVPRLMRPLWLSPTGPRTVFFWGPVVKWCVVLAGLGDVFNRPPHLISKRQTLVLAFSGALWSRWSMIIRPKNHSFMLCNAFLSVSQCLLLWRSMNHNPDSEWKRWRDSLEETTKN
ncbi:mitochondrial pyruvate carrier 2-like [Drosophila kikkawai]|uniref:Mitochondrial pyruvate carrier n=1 Tax=Drosophila kikkawai TaxID=30033 RepID=A0A6P4IUD4_DROKI|nr:mitochondrial pyruvate carrier 2-like [Drosophila kikkawai]